MAKPLLTDELWETLKLLLPHEKPRPNGGHPRVPDRLALPVYFSCPEREQHGNSSLLRLVVETA